MIERDEEIARRSKIVQKGRQGQKFKNTIRQIDPKKCYEEDEDDTFLEFEIREKIYARK